MSLTMADPSSGSPLPSMATSSLVQQTTTAVATAAAAPVAGDNNSSQLPASATVMIVIGVVLGLVGVASVITLIWWMRRRHLNRLRTDSYPAQNLYPPAPPPKTAAVNKALPNINVASANAGYRAAPPPPNRSKRSNTAGSADRDKALPVKPVESVWSPSDRPNKSPALASAQEMRSPRFTRNPHDEEMAMSRTRSDSTSRDPTMPTNFI